jgi:hypothetical protein
LRPPSLSLVESYRTIIEQRTKGKKTRTQNILITASYLIFRRLPRRWPLSTLVFLSSTLTASVCLAGLPCISLLTASFLWAYLFNFSLRDSFSLRFACRKVLENTIIRTCTHSRALVLPALALPSSRQLSLSLVESVSWKLHDDQAENTINKEKDLHLTSRSILPFLK